MKIIFEDANIKITTSQEGAMFIQHKPNGIMLLLTYNPEKLHLSLDNGKMMESAERPGPGWDITPY